jgi:ABC-type branched-subunit amino acid transport system ATPase component
MKKNESLEAIKLVKGFRGKVTILFIEHDINLVFEVPDDIVVLQQGELLYEGFAEKIKNDKLV